MKTQPDLDGVAISEIVCGAMERWRAEMESPGLSRWFGDEATESEIEKLFLYHLGNTAKEQLLIFPQYWVSCHSGRRYRIDVVCEKPDGERIAFECDGKNFHEEQRDLARDADIISTGKIHSIYRIKGSDLWYRRDDVFDVFNRLHPDLFRLPVINERMRLDVTTFQQPSRFRCRATLSRINPPLAWDDFGSRDQHYDWPDRNQAPLVVQFSRGVE